MQINSSNYIGGIEKDGIGKDGIFSSDYVNVVKTASNRLFEHMARSASGVHNPSHLTAKSLNTPGIKKEQMSEWLYTACYLLDRCCLPLMNLAANQNSQLDKLKSEKIDDQEKIIQLQHQLIAKKDEELNVVKQTVVTELKSYSSVLQENCSAALAPQKIVSAVRKVNEGEDRGKNVVIFGMEEEENEKLDTKVKVLLEKLEEKPQVLDCRRLGHSKPGISRPIRFRVRSSDIVYQILKKASLLKDIEGYQRIYISPDRTIEERITRQKLVSQLKEKRQADPNKHYVIRKGEIVCAEGT